MPQVKNSPRDPYLPLNDQPITPYKKEKLHQTTSQWCASHTTDDPIFQYPQPPRKKTKKYQKIEKENERH